MGLELAKYDPETYDITNDPYAPPEVIGSPSLESIPLGRHVDRDYGITSKMLYGGERHVLVFGPNGTGKGTRILVPALLQMGGARSVVVVDPKGELAAITAPWRRKLGRVVILNPFGVLLDLPGYDDLRSHGYNPFAQLDPAASSFNVKASQLADALVTFDPKEPHWDGSARALVAALIMFTVIEAKKLGKVPTVARMRELLCMASGEGNPRLDMPPYGLPALALEMMQSEIAGLRNKASQFTDWNREIQSIASTAKRHTEPFDDPEISNDLARDGFDFRQLKTTPTTVYLILPPEMMDRHAKWLRLVLTAAIQAVMRPRRRGEPKILFMLDEFFALGHLEIVSTVWALVRGYGVQFMPVLQDLNQLKELYPKLYETFVGMAGAVVSFTPNDLTTAEWLSRRMGETTREAMSQSDSFGTSTGTSSNTGSGPGGGTSGSGTTSGTTFSRSTSNAPVKVPFVDPHKLFGMQPGFIITTIAGLSHAVPAYAPGYYNIRQCVERSRENPYYLG